MSAAWPCACTAPAVRVPPQVLGADVAGVVLESDQGSRYPPGTRVFSCTHGAKPWEPQGGYCELVTIPEAIVAPMPGNLSFEQAAALPLVSLTAWQVCAAGTAADHACLGAPRARCKRHNDSSTALIFHPAPPAHPSHHPVYDWIMQVQVCMIQQPHPGTLNRCFNLAAVRRHWRQQPCSPGSGY
jgi:hypothetical protein